ncbi:hypothetical protein [Acidimicrobium ferrooxidans]|uniref:hypothetical protein n=1 Tax=Acidimicrobium ferrooxidans TaxID=53635 RepID=UPI0002DEC1BB|nr:hypothetical protein [Acidimicrobium ferrooxidans]
MNDGAVQLARTLRSALPSAASPDQFSDALVALTSEVDAEPDPLDVERGEFVATDPGAGFVTTVELGWVSSPLDAPAAWPAHANTATAIDTPRAPAVMLLRTFRAVRMVRDLCTVSYLTKKPA